MAPRIVPLAVGLAILLVAALVPRSAEAADSLPSPDSTGTDIVPSSFELRREGIVLPLGGAFDSGEVGAPSVLYEDGVYKMWYHGRPAEQFWQIGYATSVDGRTWTRHGVVVSPTLGVEGSATTYPFVLKIDRTYWMWYSAWDGHYRILAAQSSDGISWTKFGVSIDLGAPGEPDDYYVWEPTVVYNGEGEPSLPADAGIFRMWYSGSRSGGPTSTFLAESDDGIHWVKLGVVLEPGAAGSPDDQGARDPSVRRLASEYVMIYTGLSSDGNWRLCAAFSSDGVAWERQGVALDVAGPLESWALANANLVPGPAGTWNVYYNGRGSVFQIFLATFNLDETAPAFEGAREVSDLGTGSSVRITWGEAADPETGEFSVGPSLPIEYEVFVELDASALGAGTPRAISRDTSVVVDGLTSERTYHVIVRAVDARGNADTNSEVVSFTLKTPRALGVQFLWLVPMLIGAALFLMTAAIIRRRPERKDEAHLRRE